MKNSPELKKTVFIIIDIIIIAVILFEFFYIFEYRKYTDNFNINDFVKKDKNKSGEDSSNKRRDSFSYLQEVSQELANATSNTIELTDYEKREEDNAIISYQELLKVKDKIKVIDDDNGDVDFLEELKSFRNSLN